MHWHGLLTAGQNQGFLLNSKKSVAGFYRYVGANGLQFYQN